ncbi:AMP-binding protein [Paraburkholderia lycopersici]|uniref:1-acyl-sn-glycerol-3-phosphate acyltransferases n=1 Tax=Paraburkholderia lycopersici TaxID=416944 RepID=A0A1G6Q8A8_9BURK|nr:AMP-binding protein [Paraburkholderia lycopersici]SDC87875.1 1-acyl-sn-glycerol-3-phosphate acyltransferases [Paraburkholderia lycopersici]
MNPLPDDTRAARLMRLIETLAAELHGEGHRPGRVSMTTQLERDLGFDSLARAELAERIEQAFAVRLPPDAFAAVTPADLLKAIEGGARAAPGEAAPPARASSQVRSELAATVPEQARTVTEVLQWHARKHPDRLHLTLIANGASTELTYGALFQRAARVANALRALGVDPGARVALMLPTSAGYFVAFGALMLCGAVPVPIYPPASLAQVKEHVERHASILANAEVSTLIASAALGAVAQLLRLKVPTLRQILDGAALEEAPGHDEQAPLVRTGPHELALLQYTSGSTGEPKGVMLSHANLLSNIRAMGERMAVRPDDRLVSWLPLYHDMGLIGAWLAPLYFGFPLVAMSPLAFLARPALWLETISQRRATITAAPNFAYEWCARRLSAHLLAGLDLSSLRFAFCGSEPVNPDTLRAFAERFAPFGFDARAITPVYGLAENALAVTFPPPSRGLRVDLVQRDALATRGEAVQAPPGDDALALVACGYPLAGTGLRIVDAQRQPLAERHIGHIEFRGASATAGYYRKPEQTARLVHDGWLDSGDLGYLADGELFVTGRSKDLIIRAGRHIFPDELEHAVARLGDIEPGGVAACGEPDPIAGTERLVVIVETALREVAARADLEARVNAVVLRQCGSPAERVMLVAPHSILKTPGGKIRRAATIERLRHGTPRAKPAGAFAPWRQTFSLAAATAVPLARAAFASLRRIGRGAWCWSLAGIAFSAVGLYVTLDRDPARRWRAAAHACRIVLRAVGLNATLRGAEHLDAAAPPVLAANHTSYLDVVALLATLPQPVHFVAKRELSRQPLVGALLRALGTRFVARDDYGQGLADEAQLVECARAGETLLFFPEGTFVAAAGLRAFRLGAFRAAVLARRPVLPIAVRGARQALRDGRRVPERGGIEVELLEPLCAEGRDFHAMVSLRERTRAALLAKCAEPDAAVQAAPAEAPGEQATSSDDAAMPQP